MATGLLVIGVGRATRLLTFVVGADKTYTATIRLGQTTSTDDAEGEVTRADGARLGDGHGQTSIATLRAAAGGLRGDIEQVPSAVSAIKVDGRRAYARVRAGEEVTLAARPVTIHRLDLGDPRPGEAADGTPVIDVDVEVDCSSGTYIRALARDLGERLGVGGHLTALRRTRVGPFTLTGEAPAVPDALPAAVPADETLAETAPGALASVTTALRLLLPATELSERDARAVRYGQPIDLPAAPTGDTPELTAAFAPDGRGIAVLRRDRAGRAKPVLVLDPA